MLSPPIAIPHQSTIPFSAVQLAAVVLSIREHIPEKAVFQLEEVNYTMAPYFLMVYETKLDLIAELTRRATSLVGDLQRKLACTHGEDPMKDVYLVFQCVPCGGAAQGAKIAAPKIPLPAPVKKMKLSDIPHTVHTDVSETGGL